MVDGGGLEVGQADRLAPVIERVGHVAVDENRRLGELRGMSERRRPLRHLPRADRDDADAVDPPRIKARSEEHTSELQSLMRISYAVFCLKKKTKKKTYKEQTNRRRQQPKD